MKKTFLYQVIILASLAALVGCGGWSQNPLSKAGAMGKGQPAPTDGKVQEPLPSDFLKVDSPLFKLFKESEEGTIDISARVNADGDYVIALKITNLSDFDGATFDASTGKFTWTPPVGTAADDITEKTLEIEAVATLPGKPVIRTIRKTVIGIARGFTAPTVTEISSNDSEIREGSSDYLYVKVEDKSTGPASSQSDYPQLNILNDAGYPSIASFIEVEKPSMTSAGEFEFAVDVNLQNAELTKDRTRYAALLVPVSHLGVSGTGQELVYSVLTSLSDLTATWTSELTAKPGQKIDYQFLVLDPKGEGNVELETTDSLPAGATLDCPPDTKAYLSCRFTWDVPADVTPGSYSASVTFKNKSADYTDTYSISTPLEFPITINAAGSVQ